MPTTFPSSAPSGHPLSPARLVAAEEAATRWRTDQGLRSDDAHRLRSAFVVAAAADRPRSSFRRRPAKNAAFRKTGMALTSRHAKELFFRREALPPAFAPALPLTPPTRFPQGWGKVLLIGHCKATVRSPAGSVTGFESTDAFVTRRNNAAPGTDTQARQRARSTRPSTGAGCPARTGADRSAQTAVATESPRPDVPRTS